MQGGKRKKIIYSQVGKYFQSTFEFGFGTYKLKFIPNPWGWRIFHETVCVKCFKNQNPCM